MASSSAAVDDAASSALNFESTAQENAIVADGFQDIASRVDLAHMRVEAPGRRRFQRGVQFWIASKDSGTLVKDHYDVIKYGPQSENWPQTEMNMLPDDLELKPHENCYPCIEVGIADAGNLDVLKNKKDDGKNAKGKAKAKAKGKASANSNPNAPRNKTMEDRRRTEILDRPKHTIRVFTAETQTIATQTKFHVGVFPQGGRLQAKKIHSDFVFFYPEIWEALPIHARKNVTARRGYIGKACGKLAAEEQVSQDRSTAEITKDQAGKWKSSNPLAVTVAEDLAASVALQYDVSVFTGESDGIDAAIALLERGAKDLQLHDGPRIADSGVQAFFNFDSNLEEQEAESLSRELKQAHAHMPEISSDVILAVHAALHAEPALQTSVAYGSLPFLLEVAEKRLGAKYDNAKVISTPLSSSMLDKDQLARILASTYKLLDQTTKKLYDDGIAIIRQFGGSRKYDSIADLMKKASKAVDVKTQEHYISQMASVIACQYGVSFRDVAETLRMQTACLKRVLKKVGQPVEEEEDVEEGERKGEEEEEDEEGGDADADEDAMKQSE